ncbi:MAG: hypothetical protein GC180_00575 [Bacteroidetes bacterium]|nr:hypothetical protein [Bacteroidota bacterium]
MKKLLLLFSLFLSIFTDAQEYAIRHFTISDGLPSGNIIQVYQDRKGFLWVSSLAGISRFDGKNFVNYSLEDGLPFSYNADFCEDLNGNLYVQYGDGVARFNGLTFQNYVSSYEGVPVYVKALIRDKDGQVLVIGRDIIGAISGDSMIFYPNKDKKLFYCAATDSAGNVLIGGSGGVYRFKNKVLVPIIDEPNERVQSLLLGPDGYLWYGMLHNKLKRAPYQPEVKITGENVDIPDGDLGFIAAFLTCDSSYVFVGTQHGFLIYENGHYIKWLNNFTKIPSDMVNSIKVDREGNLWVGSLFGLWRFRRTFTLNFPNDSIRAKNVYGCRIIAPDSLLFTDGFYQYAASSKGIKEIFKDKPVQGSEIPDICFTPEGYAYFGSSLTGLVIRYPDGHYENKKFGKGPFYRCDVFDYHKGKVYMGSSHGYYVWDKDQYTEFLHKELHTKNILGMWVDDEVFLLGTNQELYQKVGDSLIDYRSFFGNKAVVIESLYRKGEYVYACTKGLGLLIARIENGRLKKDTILTSKSGLPSNYVQSSIVDQQGQIWVSTLGGIAKIVRAGSAAYYIKSFNENQGVPDAFWEYGRFEIDTSTGKLWIGNSEGILCIDPRLESKNVSPPIIQFDAIYLHNDFEDVTEIPQLIYNPQPDSLYHVPFSLNSLQIHLKGILLSGAENLEYWFHLEGMNKEWMKAPDNGILNLGNLPPGEYTLMAAAYNRANKAYSEKKSLHIIIARPFWMSTWFYISIISLFLILVSSYFRWKMASAFKKQNAAMEVTRQLSESRYLAFQARMNPHFIFNSLNAIQYFITQNDKKSSLIYLSKFARLLRLVLDHTKALKVPLNEEIQMLSRYLEMESMRFDGHFSYSFDIEDSLRISQIEIPGMLLQPFVENAIIHGLLHLETGEGHLTIGMRREGEFIICTIVDNGIGREKSASINSQRKPNHKSYGMEIAANRLQLISEETPIEELVQVTDNETGGTTVRLKLPIL